jgi:hypothetical protein
MNLNGTTSFPYLQVGIKKPEMFPFFYFEDNIQNLRTRKIELTLYHKVT